MCDVRVKWRNDYIECVLQGSQRELFVAYFTRFSTSFTRTNKKEKVLLLESSALLCSALVMLLLLLPLFLLDALCAMHRRQRKYLICMSVHIKWKHLHMFDLWVKCVIKLQKRAKLLAYTCKTRTPTRTHTHTDSNTTRDRLRDKREDECVTLEVKSSLREGGRREEEGKSE